MNKFFEICMYNWYKKAEILDVLLFVETTLWALTLVAQFPRVIKTISQLPRFGVSKKILLVFQQLLYFYVTIHKISIQISGYKWNKRKS